MSFNNHPICHNYNKLRPLGVSPNVVMALHQDYNATDCLQNVDIALIHALKGNIGGDDLIWFVSAEYTAHCKAIYDTLSVQKLMLQNFWIVSCILLCM